MAALQPGFGRTQCSKAVDNDTDSTASGGSSERFWRLNSRDISPTPSKGGSDILIDCVTDRYCNDVDQEEIVQDKEKMAAACALQDRPHSLVDPPTSRHEVASGLPSWGSEGHESGTCTPCCFHLRGRCSHGLDCAFCHEGHDKRRRSRHRQGVGNPSESPCSYDQQPDNGQLIEDIGGNDYYRDVLSVLHPKVFDRTVGNNQPLGKASVSLVPPAPDHVAPNITGFGMGCPPPPAFSPGFISPMTKAPRAPPTCAPEQVAPGKGPGLPPPPPPPRFAPSYLPPAIAEPVLPPAPSTPAGVPEPPREPPRLPSTVAAPPALSQQSGQTVAPYPWPKSAPPSSVAPRAAPSWLGTSFAIGPPTASASHVEERPSAPPPGLEGFAGPTLPQTPSVSALFPAPPMLAALQHVCRIENRDGQFSQPPTLPPTVIASDLHLAGAACGRSLDEGVESVASLVRLVLRPQTPCMKVPPLPPLACYGRIAVLSAIKEGLGEAAAEMEEAANDFGEKPVKVLLPEYPQQACIDVLNHTMPVKISLSEI